VVVKIPCDVGSGSLGIILQQPAGGVNGGEMYARKLTFPSGDLIHEASFHTRYWLFMSQRFRLVRCTSLRWRKDTHQLCNACTHHFLLVGCTSSCLTRCQGYYGYQLPKPRDPTRQAFKHTLPACRSGWLCISKSTFAIIRIVPRTVHASSLNWPGPVFTLALSRRSCRIHFVLGLRRTAICPRIPPVGTSFAP